MQMVPSVGPSLYLNPLMLPRALPSGSPLQHGSPAIDLLRPYHMDHPFSTSRVEG